jgi:peptidoglycan/xylan/chitin deacetylase (PgdA/CDA1 family)
MMRAVITFHAIDHQAGPLSFAPESLDALLGALADAEVPVLDLDALLSPETKRGVALTFDDGMQSVHTAALPILRAHQAPAHVFIVTNQLSSDNRWAGQPATAQTYVMLDWKRVEALHAGGVLIEGHTANHPDLRTVEDAMIAAELEEADAAIAAHVGRRPAYFAYPYGHENERVRNVMRHRYRASFTTRLDYLGDNDDAAALPRLDSHYFRSPRIMRALGSPLTRHYVGLRGLLRRLRGTE